MSTPTLQKENLHIVSTANYAAQAYGYQPIATGRTVPLFHLQAAQAIAKQHISGSLSREAFITLQDLLDDQQPLAIAFLGAPGQAAASIQQLEALHAAIQAQGGKLIVLTAIEPKYLRKQLKQSGTLTIFYDKDNAIAELFGLYDVQNPLWQWVSGIEAEEESLPALYVINPDSKVAFSYVDYTFGLFTGNFSLWHSVTKALLNSVNELSIQYQYQPEAYKLVS